MTDMTSTSSTAESALNRRAAPRSSTRLLARVRSVFPWVVPFLIAGLLSARWFLVPVPVTTTTVKRGPVITEVFGRGTLESRNEVELGFDVVGRIQELLVDEGDQVSAGQVLARLDLVQLAAERQAAQGGVAVARAALVRLEAEERKVTASLTFAEAEAQRAAALHERGAIPPRELDVAVERLSHDRAELERIRAARAEARQQTLAAGTSVDVRSAAAARGVLVAPFAGRVVRRLRELGDTVTVGTSVLRVVADDSMRARARIDDSALPQLALDQPVRVRFGAVGVPDAVGHIDRIGHEVDRQTHEVWVEVRLAELPSWAALGQRVDVWIETGRVEGVVGIPTKFVKWEGASSYVYAGQDGRIARVPVTLGAEGAGVVEVRDGLREADLVLDSVEAHGRLSVGRKFTGDP